MNESLRCLAAALALGAPLLGAPQIPPDPTQLQQSPQTPQSPQEQLMQQFFQLPPDQLNSTWVQQRPRPRRQFNGFPVFPTRLAGYGSYPLDPTARAAPGATTAPPLLMPPLLPGAEADEPATAWPAWVTSKQPLPYEPSVALLVQHVDRVWWQSAADEPFIPLFFHDKFALVTAGGAIEVRQAGSFELLLHETGRLVAHGPTQLQLTRMDADSIEIRIAGLTRMRLLATARSQTYELPDGSRLELQVAAKAGDPTAAADVVLERALEPSWLGGRASLTNLGERDVVWQRSSGPVTVHPGERCQFFLTKPAATAGESLAAPGLELVPDGSARQGTAQQPTRLVWCGAAFELAAGVSLRLDPLQGDPFTSTPAPVRTGQ